MRTTGIELTINFCDDLKAKRLEIPVKALARGVALLGVKVTGIEPPRLTFVTVYRLPIRLPAKKSALTWPVV